MDRTAPTSDPDPTAAASTPEEVRARGPAWRRWLPPLIGVAMLVAGVAVLQAELRDVSYPEVRATLRRLPPSALWLSVLFTVLNYAVLVCFDLLAFHYIGRRISAWKVSVASFAGYAISNAVGFALISGTSVRYRFYSRWSLTGAEISRIIVFYSGTFWLGLLVLGGWSLTFDPHPRMLATAGRVAVYGSGIALLVSAVAYAALALLRKAPLKVGPVEIPIPPARTVALQYFLSTVDWAFAAAVLYVLLPPTQLTFSELLSAFLAAQLFGLISHVPGGVGVFEGTMVFLLRDYMAPEQLVSSLLLYRIVYYVVPLAAALGILVADEVRIRRHVLARWGSAFGALTGTVTPKLLAAFTFLSGVVLLVSGSTPIERERALILDRWLPLAVIETSHFLGSVAGVGLLFISNGVFRRLDIAWYMAAGTLVAGIAASLLKGMDYEEALLLSGVLAALAASRPAFDRKARFWAARFSAGWVASVIAVVGASIWLGGFAFSHVEYSSELWWRFALREDVPRFLRASVGATVAILAFGVLRLMRPAPPEEVPPTDGELEEAGRLIATQPSTPPYLVYLRDKALLFNPERTAFLMYAVQGKTWVAYGDPVGDPAAHAGLLRQFFGRCDDFGGIPVFYQVPRESLHRYADFGLTFVKLGEEAWVPLEGFHLDGAERKPFRLVLNRFARSGMRFRVVERDEVPALLAQAREVSDDWLREKDVGEKGFSLGFWSDDFVRRFPMAVVEDGDRVVAFATLWPGPDGTELSVDLMRYRADAPKNVMEVLLLQLMLWGKERGYRRFNLGMAPLSGLEMSAVAPFWTRVGKFLFERGGALYNFQGLRTYKEKFHPVWEPRYLAYPGGLNLPRILADVSALVAGGYRRIFRR